MNAWEDPDPRPQQLPHWISGHAAPAARHRRGPAIQRLPADDSSAADRSARDTRLRGSRGGGLLAVASCLLLLLAAAQGYVSFRAQYTFIDHAKQARLPVHA